MRQINSNSTQILHKIRLKKFVPNTPFQDNYFEKLQPDDEIVIPKDDLYTLSWEVDFDYELFETRKINWPVTATRIPSDTASDKLDDYVTKDERSSAHEDECSGERNESDVTEKEIRPRPARSGDVTSPLNEPPSVAQNENDVTNDLNNEEFVSKGRRYYRARNIGN